MRYPGRPKMFAMKFCRQLSKRAVAMQIGADGCWLLTVIAMQEDASHYEVAPQYYDIQLADRCGWHRTKVDRVRQKCIDAGYLHYEPGPHRGTSTYWVLLPSRSLPDDEPTSHGATQTDDTSSHLTSQIATSTAPQMHANCTPNAHEMRTGRDTYIPDPVPDPVPDKSKAPSPSETGSGGDGVSRMIWGRKREEREIHNNACFDELFGTVVASGFALDTDEDRQRFAALIVNIRRNKCKNRVGLLTRVIEGRSNDKFSKPGDDWRARAKDSDHDRGRDLLRRLDDIQPARVEPKHIVESESARELSKELERQVAELSALIPKDGKAAS